MDDVTAAFAAALTAEGYRVRQVLPGETAQRLSDDRYQADLASPESVRRLHQLLSGAEGTVVGGVIQFLGLCPPFVTANLDETEMPLRIAEWTFNIVKEFVSDLQTSAEVGGGWFINLTALDGQFGLSREIMSCIAASGTLGIVKTLHREYPRLHVKNIDVDPHMPADKMAACLLQEVAMEDDLVEIGLTQHGRWRPTLTAEPVPRNLPLVAIDRDAVILVTGGAYGVTAEVARGLAALTKLRLIVVGRSPLPAPESSRSSGLDKAGLRALLLDEARARTEKILPAEIERSVNRILKDRQMRANLDACTAAGAAVEYHALDVRDSERFGRLIDNLYERFGRIDGVVHGAGILADKRIADKTLDSFANVFRTKVDSALTLARKLRPDSLRFLVFFGSVAGRFGNVGQVDYSAANEVLNKLADHLHRRWPGRVVCINWGPWDGGMVTDELRRLYTAAGLELISVEAGVASFLAEIGRTDRASAEVVISRMRFSATKPISHQPAAPARDSLAGAAGWPKIEEVATL
ncbi:MAG TPA: SDR family NAD(P)-dependent oxidoreductase [Gemmataceae bacterium]|nr:SDR family NAD(P)-dependent oxidoreductase [Gemmataceae bacterium]